MGDVRDRIEREGDQQRRKGSVQPTWRSSREPEGAHGSEITECANRLRHASPACKAPEARILELREIGSLAVVMLPARLVRSRIASGLRDDRPVRRTTKLLSCIALGLALLVAQTGALRHTTSHSGEPQDPSGLHSQLCEACVSFSTIFSMAGGPGTTPCCRRRSWRIWSTSRCSRSSSTKVPARSVPARLLAGSSSRPIPAAERGLLRLGLRGGSHERVLCTARQSP